MRQMPPTDSLYLGRVMHARKRPFAHSFRYSVFSLWLDIDHVGDAAQGLALLSYNRWNLFSFFDRDHGPRVNNPLRPWVEKVLAEADIAPPGGPIKILCFPRILGFAFNPISLICCYAPDGPLRAVIYEVHNTVGGQHCYVVPVADADSDTALHHTAEKVFYVSPFIGMQAHYHFTLKAPGDDFALKIDESVDEGPQLVATHVAERRDLSSWTLMKALASRPMMLGTVMIGILWEALRIWRKGGQYHAPPAEAMRIAPQHTTLAHPLHPPAA